jgi:hypothetical protein
MHYLKGSVNRKWVDSDRTYTLEFAGYRVNVG